MHPGVHAAETPERPAVVAAETGAVLTYGELEERSARLANVFGERGLVEGDAVAVLTDNDPRGYEVYWAGVRAGLYVCAVNSHLTADEVAYVVDDAQARVLVVSAALREVAEAVADRLPAVTALLSYGGEVAGYRPLDEALAEVSPRRPEREPQGAALLYSSGTTGLPKGIKPPLPGCALGEAADALLDLLSGVYGVDSSSVYLSPAPFYHAAPLRYSTAVHSLGGTVVLMHRFDAEAALASIERHGVTHSQWVPTMFVRMLRLDRRVRERYDLSAHRVAIHAAAPCPPDVKRAMIDWWGPILHEYYSSTEAIGMTLIDSEQWLARPGSVGRAVVGEPHVCDEDGTELATGEIGAVYFERDEVPFEYLGDPEKTRASRHPEHGNWATVGDLGYLDEEGFLYLTDRAGNMIISGGVNIYPQEVENVLLGHPEVLDAAVFGVPDPEMGESVRAVVSPVAQERAGPELERDVIDHVRTRVAHYKAPRGVDFAQEVPRTPTGKLLREQLRQRYAERS
ncbi:acyl-CoA synthetase [Salinifilum ghardaiensis]